ncbi:hypothetical protein [Variovorax sp. YR216]|uniref:hypothetical protein n=1 Tax=Variovorax sp. YR216 TaxID=1882828 RepID=UPI000896B8D0|nr:hypothetical protein SAMN05444680_116107 [Variovorax sp. YR216]
MAPTAARATVARDAGEEFAYVLSGEIAAHFDNGDVVHLGRGDFLDPKALDAFCSRLRLNIKQGGHRPPADFLSSSAMPASSSEALISTLALTSTAERSPSLLGFTAFARQR